MTEWLIILVIFAFIGLITHLSLVYLGVELTIIIIAGIIMIFVFGSHMELADQIRKIEKKINEKHH